ncbi:MAG: hypothetical protein ACI857_001637 [Arenicella sp.]|jgi:hypothetical protein
MKLVFFCLLFSLFHLSFGQTFDYKYFSDSTNLDLDLIEITSDGGTIGIGDSVLLKTDNLGTIVWAKQIDSKDILSLDLDSDDNIYFLCQEEDSAGYKYSKISKLNPDGFHMWTKNIGNGFDEVEYFDVFLENDFEFYAGGGMKTDSVWHNIVSKYNYAGTEIWTRRLFHYYGDFVGKNTDIIKIDQSPSGKLFALGTLDTGAVVYKFNSDGGWHSFEAYNFKDSLIPIDLIANDIDDIQILFNTYSFLNHSPERTTVKMQINEYMDIQSSKEYSIDGSHLEGQDLEVYNESCFILANETSSFGRTLIQRTNSAGDHDLAKLMQDQDVPQKGFDLEVMDDYSIRMTYDFEPDYESVLSQSNHAMQTNCSSYFDEIEIMDVTMTQHLATGLVFSAAYPTIQTGTFLSQELSILMDENMCEGFSQIENNETSINIYPNPATDIIHLESNDSEFEYTIYSLKGKLMNTGTENTLDVSDWPNGIYVLKFQDDSGIQNFKFTVIH